MIKITNGEVVTEVTIGAYLGVMKSLGYSRIIEDDEFEKDVEVEQTDSNSEFINNLLEKPISGWNKDELKKFTEIKGIDTAAAKNVADVKDIVKKWLDENE